VRAWTELIWLRITISYDFFGNKIVMDSGFDKMRGKFLSS
jgi:hypothetical protein